MYLGKSHYLIEKLAGYGFPNGRKINTLLWLKIIENMFHPSSYSGINLIIAIRALTSPSD